MKTRSVTLLRAAVLSGAVTAGMLVSTALAHHSFAMFEHEKKISGSGTMKEFEYTNPHCWLHITAPDASNGRTVDWSFEM